jgi:hypothetical protein
MSTREISTLVRQLVEATQSRRRRPSERNLRIYEEVRVEGLESLEVAVSYGVSRRRVSAICQQVDRWYGEQEPWRLGDPQGVAGQRAERLVAKRRLEHVYYWALRGLKCSGQSITEGHTTIPDGGPTVRKQVQKDQNFNVQWLKVAKGVAEELLTLATEKESGEVAPPPRVARGEAVLRAAACLRRAIRQEVAQGGPERVGKLVEQVVLACVGQGPAAIESKAPIVPAATLAEGPRADCANYSTAGTEIPSDKPKVTATGVVASPAPAASCESASERKSAIERAETVAEKNVGGIGSQEVEHGPQSGGGHVPTQSVGTSVAQSVGMRAIGLADQERRALSEIERQFCMALTREQADQAATEILAQGAAQAALQGYDARQRAALIEWRRLMEARGKGSIVIGHSSFVDQNANDK